MARNSDKETASLFLLVIMVAFAVNVDYGIIVLISVISFMLIYGTFFILGSLVVDLCRLTESLCIKLLNRFKK